MRLFGTCWQDASVVFNVSTFCTIPSEMLERYFYGHVILIMTCEQRKSFKRNTNQNTEFLREKKIIWIKLKLEFLSSIELEKFKNSNKKKHIGQNQLSLFHENK